MYIIAKESRTYNLKIVQILDKIIEKKFHYNIKSKNSFFLFLYFDKYIFLNLLSDFKT